MDIGNLRRQLCLLASLGLGLLWLAGAAPVQANTIVQFDTNMGDFSVELYDNVVPTTVANFLSYVSSAKYNDSMVHRSTHVTDSGIGVIQGGGFDTQAVSIPTSSPIPLEAGLSNVRGTLAMARTSVPNSATSQWFINTVDNSTFLDKKAGIDGYAVFGKVLGDGMTVVDAINGVKTFVYAAPFAQVPLRNFTTTDFNTGVDPLPHVVEIFSVTVVPAPEPSTSVLAGIALLAGAFGAWRGRHSNRKAQS